MCTRCGIIFVFQFTTMKQFFSLSVALLMLSVFSCSNAQDGSGSSYKDLDANALEKAMVETPGTVLDVRTPEEVAQGMLANAVHINIHDTDFKERATALDKDKPVYVYCKSGGRSSRACKQLVGMGFTMVYNLEGGITGWNAANKPVVHQ